MIDLRLAGALDRPDGDGRAGGGACDDRVRITIRVDDGRLAAVRFATDGCPATLAAAAWLAAAAEGRTLLDAARLGSVETLASLTVTPARRRCVDVAVDALHAALGDAVVRGAGQAPVPGRVAVAMSGGVDSAVALAEAAGPAADVVGLTLRLWIDPAAPDPERACCAPAAVRAARDTCHAHGAAHLALDLRASFQTAVVEPFVAAYAAGETPNPCVRCNGGFRFDALVDVAERLGAGELHTGHYARRVEVEGRTLVARGLDERKDQSYMLASLEPALLRRVRFPLGSRTKEDARAAARARGLAAAEAAESQEVCFLGGGALRPFLARQGVGRTPGPIEAEDGAVLGTHDGAAGYTPGQRRGIGVSGPEPLYVLRTEPERNAVVVAPRRRLGVRRVRLADGRLHVERRRVAAKLRYRSTPVAATVERDGPDLVLLLDEPVAAVAPGQTAALYVDDVVVGAGTISAVAP